MAQLAIGEDFQPDTAGTPEIGSDFEPDPGPERKKTPEGRPIVQNPDGSISTEITSTVGFDGKYYNVPTLFGGAPVSPQEGLTRVIAAGMRDPETGREITPHDTIEAAVAAAKHRSESLGKTLGDQSAIGSDFAPDPGPYVGRFSGMAEQPVQETEIEKRAKAAVKQVIDKIGLPTSIDEVKHELDLLGFGQETPFPLPRPFPEDAGAGYSGIEKGLRQVNAAVMNFPADIWNFATSPAGVALGGMSALGPMIQKAVTLGFSVDQIRSGLQANNLQDQVEAALGTALAAHATLHEFQPKAEEAKPKAESAPAIGADFEPDSVAVEPTRSTITPEIAAETTQPAASEAVVQVDNTPAPQPWTEGVPFMAQVRIEDQLKAAGIADEQIPTLTQPQVDEILAAKESSAPPEISAAPDPIPAATEFPAPPEPASQRELSPEEIAAAQMEAEHRAELLAQADEAQASTGPELLDAVVDAGGLPSKLNPNRGEYSGEIAALEDMVRDPNRNADVNPIKLFRRDASHPDELATRLRDRGFDVQTPDDVVNLLDTRLRTGRKIFGAPELARTMAGENEKVYAMGTAAHRTKPTLAPAPPPTPIVAAAAAPVKSWWQQRTVGIRKLVAPQTIDKPARMVANIIRDYNGQLANTIVRADHALAAARKEFDRTPVPRSWKYDPNKPLPRNYAFIDNSERGGANLSPQDRQLKSQIDAMFTQAIDEVHRVEPAALKNLIQNYFPHIWEDPEQAQRVFGEIMSKRPLEGPKGFLKQRVLEYTIDGLKAGLRPISDNPIDMALTKLHEVHRFVAAQDMLSEAKAIGARKFVYIFEQGPEGWRRVDDPTSTVHAPPFVTVAEAFDEQMKIKTVELLNKLGVPHERVASLGGQRWGTYSKSTGIRTKFAGPMSVYWHELGHALEERYGLIDTIAHDAKQKNLGGKSEIENQLRKLADLRAPQTGGTESFKKYIRTKDEKAAAILEAYVHAPEKMRDVAPNVYTRMQKFIAAHPELKPLNDIRPNLSLAVAKQQIPVGGLVTLGHYYMPDGAAQVFTNYLSPGLQRFGIIRAIRQSTNILSGLQLGFSAFHAGFTSIDAAVSQFALGLRYLTEGKPIKALGKIATTPAAPLTNYLSGRRVQRAMLEPGYGSPEIQRIGEFAVKAGLRATVDPFWKTQITRSMVRAFHEGGVKRWVQSPLQLPFAAAEQMMRPILEYLVPRQKLGVFAGMAQAHLERLGPNADIHAVRDAMARAADATEDRMGQMTYDNLFYNRVVRDAALMGFRAYGWTYGKYRALFGGMSDVLQTPGRIREGGPAVTDRMLYLVALPMLAAGVGSTMNYLMTGEPPRDWKDALMPRTGRLDRHGNPQRLSLPTYIKDILSDWHDFPNTKKMLVSFSHKLNPWLDVAADVINNADFYGTKIYNEDDPLLKQQADKFLFVMKSATPFSVTGAAKLSESKPSLMQQVLPFFGFVPAKQELTMTPAQIRAAELFYDTLPRGARTADQAEHSKMVATLLRDMKEEDPNWQQNLDKSLDSGELQPKELGRLFKSMPLDPLQYQVKKLSVQDAMKVWDLASPSEREGLRKLLMTKVSKAKMLLPADKTRYFDLLLK